MEARDLEGKNSSDQDRITKQDVIRNVSRRLYVRSSQQE